MEKNWLKIWAESEVPKWWLIMNDYMIEHNHSTKQLIINKERIKLT
jgi:hypothetical protein